MNIPFSKIKDVAWGAARITEENGSLSFYRCTDEEEAFFKSRSDEFYRNSLGTAGVRLVFETDSTALTLHVTAESLSDWDRFSFDVFVNGTLAGYLDNFSDAELPLGEKHIALPMGRFSKSFALGQGRKEVSIHFPYSVKGMIDGIELDDGATCVAIKPKKQLLAFGDSITQGFCALRPSARYTARLANYLGAEERNKGIGSDRFCPALADVAEKLSPDYVVIAHGTNDWRTNQTRETFRLNGGAFIRRIREKYPASKMLVLSPLWRKDYLDERPFGDFTKADKDLRTVVQGLENVTVVRGFDLIPHEEKYFGDFFLHPNDCGFELYFENLLKQWSLCDS